MSNDPVKPDFSNVKSGSGSTAKPAPEKPDFSNVGSGAASTARTVDDASAVQSYTVEGGDTLSGIAKKFYGDAGKWRQIFEANTDQISDPDRINVGQVIKIPAGSKPSGSASTVQTYTIEGGDTLSGIAKKFYGDAGKWRQIFEANTDRLSNPDKISVGQVIKIPADTP